MADTRPRVTYSKRIDLSVLDQALGGHGLCASDTEIVVAEGSPVTQKQLADAVAAHSAPTAADRLAALKAATTVAQVKAALVELLD